MIRYLLKSIGLVVLIAVGAGLTVFYYRTEVLGLILHSELASFGISNAKFKVAHIGDDETRLENVRLGLDLQARVITLSYRFPNILDGDLSAITIIGLKVDVSDPTTGAIGAIGKSMAAGREMRPASVFPRPLIHVKDAEIITRRNGVSLTVEFNGTLEADGSGQFTVSGGAAFADSQDNLVSLNNLRIEFDSGNDLAGANMTLKGGVLSKEGAFAPLLPMTVSGNVSFRSNKVSGDFDLVNKKRDFKMKVSAAYGLDGNEGEATFKLEPFQLQGLWPGLEDLRGLVNFTSHVLLARGKVSGKADVKISNAAVPGIVEEVNTSIQLKTDGSLNRISFALRNGSARLITPERNLIIKGLTAMGSLDRKGNATIDSVRAQVRDGQQPSLFTPVLVRGAGAFTASRVSFKANLMLASGVVKAAVSGSHDLDRRSGFATLNFPPFFFKRGGLQPKNLLHLLDLPMEIAVRLSGLVDARWSPKGVDISATTNIQKGSVTIGGMFFDNISAQVRSAPAADGSGVRLQVSEGTVDVSTRGHAFKLENVRLSLVESTDAKSIAFKLTNARIVHATPNPLFTNRILLGQARLAGNVVTFKGDSEAVSNRKSGGKIRFEGRHDLDSKSGAANITLESLVFQRGGAQPADSFPIVTFDAILEGGVSARTRLGWADGKINGDGDLVLDGLSIFTDSGTLEGIRGTLHLDSLDPPSMNSSRLFTAKRIRSVVSLINPSIRYRLESGAGNARRLHIERAEVGFGGGIVYIENTVLDSTKTTHKTILNVDRVDLGFIMGLLGLDGVSGEGTLVGSIPLEFRSSGVLIDNARLQAAKPGVLIIRSKKAERLLADGGEQVRLLLSVLHNFHYESLSLVVNKSAVGDALIKLSTKGVNPDVLDGQPFVLNINLTGNMDRIADAVLTGYRLSEQALKGNIRRAFERQIGKDRP